MTGCIVGWAHERFGKLDADDIESLICRAALAAIEDAGIAVEDVDEIFVGNFNGGFHQQDFTGALALNADERLRFTPATRVENACATGSAAIHQGLNAVAAGRRFVLVVGAEKMTATPGPRIGEVLLGASYRAEEGETAGGFAGIFGRIAETYFQRHGDRSEALARIAAKNHANGTGNPYAQMRKDLGFRFCSEVSEKNPRVAGPLRRTDCALVSDGAAALVLAPVEDALALDKAVIFRAAAHVNDVMPIGRRDIIRFEGAAEAWCRALTGAGLGLDDLDLVETHDCFTIAELIEYEAMGLTAAGDGARAIEEGWTHKGGRLPINPSGGLKSKGHPIGATGVSMHVLAALQLMDQAGEMQIDGAETAGIFNMGGAAVANYVSLLQRLR